MGAQALDILDIQLFTGEQNGNVSVIPRS